MILFNYKNSLRQVISISKTILIFLYNTIIPMEDKGLPFCKFLILNTILIKDILKLISISFKSKFILGIKKYLLFMITALYIISKRDLLYN